MRYKFAGSLFFGAKGLLARIRMLARLKYFLGDQKIDIIGDHEDSPVAREALMTGIRLV